MLLPKRVKYRRVHRGRLKGAAHKGNTVTYGQFGLQALEPAWITSNQIEAARIPTVGLDLLPFGAVLQIELTTT
ncbi:MAG: ribosomal protein L16, partial [Clostridia bacterium]|nr:ribosomal protein L16 [Clostridia bacterium]